MKNFKYFIYAILLIFILSIQAFAIMGIKAPGPSVDSGDPTMASKAKETQTVNPIKITNQPGRLKIYSTANTNGWGLLGPTTATTNTYLIPTEESANSGETIITGVPYVATVNGEPATIIPFTWGTVASGGSSSIAINGSTITDPNFVNATEINIINNSGNISSSINNGSINISKLSAASVLNISEMTSETVTNLDDTTVMTAGAVYSLIAQILGLPDIVISSPVNNGWVSNSSIITGTASDTGGTIGLIEWKLETGGTYVTTGVTGTTNWSISGINFGTDGIHNLYTRVTDNEGNTKESHIVVNSDNIDPVVGVITPSSLTHDGTGPTLTATVGPITEAYESSRQWSLYDVTDAAVQVAWTTFTGLSIAGISIPADQHTYRVDVRCTDLAGNVGTASSANITYNSGVSLLIDQSFNTSVSASTEGWTNPQGTVSFYNTSSPIEGAGSLLISGGYGLARTPTFSTTGTCSVAFSINMPSASASTLVSLRNSTDGFVDMIYDGTRFYLNINGISSGIAVNATYSNGPFYIWIDVTKGTGANGVVSLYVSTTASKPASPGSTSSTTSNTTDVVSVDFGSTNAANLPKYDVVKISETIE